MAPGDNNIKYSVNNILKLFYRLAAVGLLALPAAEASPIPGEVAAREPEAKAQPWKEFVKAREAEPAEMFNENAPIRIKRHEALAPGLIEDK
ncbi:hypothetical protein MMC24_003828 [Lignoscripta atroalba]|nr:hypothetical protein [Lignoscripta atroalba]